MSAGHARAIAGAGSADRQVAIARRAAEEGLSVREVEKLVNANDTPGKKRPKAKDPEIGRIEEELKEKFGTKVNINGSEKRGKVELEYYSKDELERLIDTLRNI